MYSSTNDSQNPSFTVWQSIKILTDATLHMQKELDTIKKIFPYQNVTLQKGNKLLHSDAHEANITLDGKVKATLPKIGYHLFNNELIIHNHITAEEVKIPHDFHYLKVAKLNYDDYKLTFCNILGNEFFEYKKYDPQYSNISYEYKFVDLSDVKKIYTPRLKEHLKYAPAFLIAEGSIEPGSLNHAVDLFELTQGSKGKKIGTLIDEFGYLDKDGSLHYHNYHEDKVKVYEPKALSIKVVNMTVDQSSEFQLIENGNIVFHSTLESLGIF